jgi:hypothetical protein
MTVNLTAPLTAGDGRVVFVPKNADGVGVFNPTDDSFTLVPVGVTGDTKFAGAAVAGDGRVVFAPRKRRRRGGVRLDGQQFTLVSFVAPHDNLTRDDGNLPAPRRRATAGWCSHLRKPPALVFSTRQPRLEVSLRWCPSSPRTTTSTDGMEV